MADLHISGIYTKSTQGIFGQRSGAVAKSSVVSAARRCVKDAARRFVAILGHICVCQPSSHFLLASFGPLTSAQPRASLLTAVSSTGMMLLMLTSTLRGSLHLYIRTSYRSQHDVKGALEAGMQCGR